MKPKTQKPSNKKKGEKKGKKTKKPYNPTIFFYNIIWTLKSLWLYIEMKLFTFLFINF